MKTEIAVALIGSCSALVIALLNIYLKPDATEIKKDFVRERKPTQSIEGDGATQIGVAQGDIHINGATNLPDHSLLLGPRSVSKFEDQISDRQQIPVIVEETVKSSVVSTGIVIKSNLPRLGLNLDMRKLLDGDPDTTVRMNSTLLTKLHYTFSFQESIQLSEIYLLHPKNVDIDEQLSSINIRARSSITGDWSKWKNISISSVGGRVYLDVDFPYPISEIEFDPKRNRASKGFATLGDIYFFKKLSVN